MNVELRRRQTFPSTVCLNNYLNNFLPINHDHESGKIKWNISRTFSSQKDLTEWSLLKNPLFSSLLEQTARDTFESYVNNIRGPPPLNMYTHLVYSKGIEFPPKSTRNKENEKVLS